MVSSHFFFSLCEEEEEEEERALPSGLEIKNGLNESTLSESEK